jgi:hypothetical protein
MSLVTLSTKSRDLSALRSAPTPRWGGRTEIILKILCISVIALVGGCGKGMYAVIDSCNSLSDFDSHLNCVKNTYAKDGRFSMTNPLTLTFFRNVDAVKFLFDRKIISADEAKSAVREAVQGVGNDGTKFVGRHLVYKEELEFVEIAVSSCQRMGLGAGSAELNNCVVQQQQLRLQRLRQSDHDNFSGDSLRLIQQQQSMQLMEMGLKMMTPPQPIVSPTITCTRMPGSYTTTCR